MNSQHGPTESAASSPSDNIRTLCVSATVATACFALYVAENHGFRIFDENAGNILSAELNIPSPLEVLTMLGVTSVGVCAAMVAAISIGAWLVAHVRHLHAKAHHRAADHVANEPVHHGTA